MTEKIGHIKNPLTIIAIFAGLAEVGGTIVLPFLEEPVQKTYVWFLMGFPAYLVSVFFLVLWFKREVFYAPSDFRDDSTFKDILSRTVSAENVKEIEYRNRSAKMVESAAATDTTDAVVVPAEPKSFADLIPQARKIVKTLWKFQCEHFPNDFSNRWGFGVRLGSPDYLDFTIGVTSAIGLQLVVIDNRGFCYLSDKGFTFCADNKIAIDSWTEFYSEFLSLP